jgi:hypothetical protein
MAGTPGACGLRAAPVTASARTCPSRERRSASGMLPKTMSARPPGKAL